VVAEEGLGDQDIEPNAKQPGACRAVRREDMDNKVAKAKSFTVILLS